MLTSAPCWKRGWIFTVRLPRTPIRDVSDDLHSSLPPSTSTSTPSTTHAGTADQDGFRLHRSQSGISDVAWWPIAKPHHGWRHRPGPGRGSGDRRDRLDPREHQHGWHSPNRYVAFALLSAFHVRSSASVAAPFVVAMRVRGSQAARSSHRVGAGCHGPVGGSAARRGSRRSTSPTSHISPGCCRSAWVREGADPTDRVGDLFRPWPVAGESRALLACGRDELGSGTEQPRPPAAAATGKSRSVAPGRDSVTAVVAAGPGRHHLRSPHHPTALSRATGFRIGLRRWVVVSDIDGDSRPVDMGCSVLVEVAPQGVCLRFLLRVGRRVRTRPADRDDPVEFQHACRNVLGGKLDTCKCVRRNGVLCQGQIRQETGVLEVGRGQDPVLAGEIWPAGPSGS